MGNQQDCQSPSRLPYPSLSPAPLASVVNFPNRTRACTIQSSAYNGTHVNRGQCGQYQELYVIKPEQQMADIGCGTCSLESQHHHDFYRNKSVISNNEITTNDNFDITTNDNLDMDIDNSTVLHQDLVTKMKVLKMVDLEDSCNSCRSHDGTSFILQSSNNYDNNNSLTNVISEAKENTRIVPTVCMGMQSVSQPCSEVPTKENQATRHFYQNNASSDYILVERGCSFGGSISKPFVSVHQSTGLLGISNKSGNIIEDDSSLEQVDLFCRTSDSSSKSFNTDTSVGQLTDWECISDVQQQEPCDLIETTRYSVFYNTRTRESYAMVYDSLDVEETNNLTDTEKTSRFHRHRSSDSADSFVDLNPEVAGSWPSFKCSPTTEHSNSEKMLDLSGNKNERVCWERNCAFSSSLDSGQMFPCSQTCEDPVCIHDVREGQALHGTLPWHARSINDTVNGHVQSLHNIIPGQAHSLHCTDPGHSQSLRGTDPGHSQSLHGTDPGHFQSLHGTDPGNSQFLHGTDHGHSQSLHGTDPGHSQSLNGTDPGNSQFLHGTDHGHSQSLHGTDPGHSQYLPGTDHGHSQSLHGTDPGNSQSLHGTYPGLSQSLHGTDPRHSQSLHGTDPRYSQSLHGTDPGHSQSLHGRFPGKVQSLSETVIGQIQSFPATDRKLVQSIPCAVSGKTERFPGTVPVQIQSNPCKIHENAQPFPGTIHEQTRQCQNQHTDPHKFSKSYGEATLFNIKPEITPGTTISNSDYSNLIGHPVTPTDFRCPSELHDDLQASFAAVHHDSFTTHPYLSGKSRNLQDRVRALYHNRRGISVNFLDLKRVETLTASHLMVDKHGNCEMCRGVNETKLFLKEIIPIQSPTSTAAATNQPETTKRHIPYRQSFSADDASKRVKCHNHSNFSPNMQTPSQLLSNISAGSKLHHLGSSTQSIYSHDVCQDCYVKRNNKNGSNSLNCDRRKQMASGGENGDCERCSSGDVGMSSSRQNENIETLFRFPVDKRAVNLYNKHQNNFVAYLCCAEENLLSFGLSFHRQLEEWGMKIFIKERDLQLVGPEYKNMAEHVEESCNGKIIVILSKSYANSAECLFLTYFAKTLDPDSKNKNIIPVLIDNDVEIPSVLQGLTIINYKYVSENGWLKHKIINAIAA